MSMYSSCADEDGMSVTIPYSVYKSLTEDRNFLNRLRAAGVDNWEGYSEAFDEDGFDD